MRTFKFRYVAVDPARADGKHIQAIGKAGGLLDFLINHQTDSEGWVYYGKLINYAWIEDRLPNPPPRRTLERWMARLNHPEPRHCVAPYIEVFASRAEHGMYVRILNQTKFPKVQIPLFAPPKPVAIDRAKTVDKPVEIEPEGSTSLPPQMAGGSRHKWRISSLYIEKGDEERYGASGAAEGGHPVENEEEFKAELQRLSSRKSLDGKPLIEMSDEEKQNRLEQLHEQARMLDKKFKAAG